MPQQQLETKKGFVTLLSIIILIIISGLITQAILLSNINSFKSLKLSLDSIEARNLANACIEISLNKIKSNLTYSGNENIALGNGECQILVIGGSGNNNRTIRTIGIVGDNVKKIEVVLQSINPNAIVTSWQEKDF